MPRLHTYADMGHQLVTSLFEEYVRVSARNIAMARSDAFSRA
ncbi:hypothetical protein [Nocardioides sp.]